MRSGKLYIMKILESIFSGMNEVKLMILYEFIDSNLGKSDIDK